MIDERRLYQKNHLGYYLMLVFIITNAVNSVFTLNAMPNDQQLGVVIMITILFLLLGFLIAVKVRVYSLGWSYTAIVLGFIQAGRILFTDNSLEGSEAMVVSLLLVISGLFSIGGGVVSVIACRLRKASLEGTEAHV